MTTVLYSEIRDQIKTGDLLAWKTTKIRGVIDFILFLYQKILGAQFTHVGIAIVIGNRYFIVEATIPVVRLMPISMTSDFYLIPTSIKHNENHIDYLMHHLGKKYSLLDLIKGVLKLGTDDNEFYCSELAGEFYNDIGYIDNDEASLTPDSLIDEVTKTNGSVMLHVKNDVGNLSSVV